MCPVIRIKDETWERLKTFAVPLEDSVDDVINRLIDSMAKPANVVGARESESQVTTAPVPAATAPPVPRPQARGISRRSRRPLTAEVLRTAGVIKDGTKIGVLLPLLPPGAGSDDKRFTATFSYNARDVIWDYDGQEYSLSRLTMDLADAPFNVRANKESENGFRIWGLLGDRHTSLETRRKNLDGRE